MKRLRLLTVLPLLCSACSTENSHPESSKTAEPTVAATKAPANGIDEKNGFRDHHFGDDIAAFQGLVPATSYGPDEVKAYQLPKGSENLMLGDVKLASIIYSFHKGKFYSVLVQADKPDNASFDKLTATATALYGKGKEFTSGAGTGWYGDKVNGSVAIERGSGNRVLQLHLTSKIIEKQMEGDKLAAGKKAASDL